MVTPFSLVPESVHRQSLGWAGASGRGCRTSLYYVVLMVKSGTVSEWNPVRVDLSTDTGGLDNGRTCNLCFSACLFSYFSSVQSLSCVPLFATPWTAACQASLSITNSRSLLKLMSIESVMPSNYLILCHPFFLLPSIFPSIRVFSNESGLV